MFSDIDSVNPARENELDYIEKAHQITVPPTSSHESTEARNTFWNRLIKYFYPQLKFSTEGLMEKVQLEVLET